MSLNIQLKKHKESGHEAKIDEILKYKCESCAFSSDYLLHMWGHREANHSEQTPHFFPKSMDMLLAMLAEQNFDILEELEALKKSIKGAFVETAEFNEMNIYEVKNLIIEKAEANQKEIEKLGEKN